MEAGRIRDNGKPIAQHFIGNRVTANGFSALELNLAQQVAAVNGAYDHFGHDGRGHPAGGANGIVTAIAELIRCNHCSNAQSPARDTWRSW